MHRSWAGLEIRRLEKCVFVCVRAGLQRSLLPCVSTPGGKLPAGSGCCEGIAAVGEQRSRNFWDLFGAFTFFFLMGKQSSGLQAIVEAHRRS